MLATNKFVLFVKDILPALLARAERETVASVGEHVDAVIQAFIIKGLVEAEVNHVRTAHLVEPIVRRQIECGVDVALTRGRLIEVLIHQGREDAADAAIETFKAQLLPEFEKLDGFRSASLFVDRATGRGVGSTVWASREELDSSREHADRIRAMATRVTGAQIVDVAEFRLGFAHLRVPEMV